MWGKILRQNASHFIELYKAYNLFNGILLHEIVKQGNERLSLR